MIYTIYLFKNFKNITFQIFLNVDLKFIRNDVKN